MGRNERIKKADRLSLNWKRIRTILPSNRPQLLWPLRLARLRLPGSKAFHLRERGEQGRKEGWKMGR